MSRRLLFVLLLLLLAGGLGTMLWMRAQLRASLPALDGAIRLSGMTAPATVSRDTLGVASIRGASREDVARATGFVHAQDRFFQMDLSRRRAAGELAGLVGERALRLDRETRLHRFRAEAREAVRLLKPRDRAILEAYTAGVNAGLAHLRAAPFEYLLLRQTPQPWRTEDSMLVILSMFLTLQDSEGVYESMLATMHDVLPSEMVAFLVPRGSEWDAPVTGETFAAPPIPGPEIYNLRSKRSATPAPTTLPLRRPEVVQRESGTIDSVWALSPAGSDEAIGSNSFAVAGSLTNGHGALLANDMHLQIRVPNIWYRTEMQFGDTHLIGVTLPGHPTLVVGSNTHVAWGFTNTYADWTDIVLLELDPASHDRYRTPDGWHTIERFDEVIQVAGGRVEHIDVAWTIWGPVIAPDHAGRPRALRWVAHSATQLAARVTAMEDARTVEEAFASANGIGTPGQNLLVADDRGRIGWSIYGSIPRRVGIDGRLPASWADGSRGWNGWLTPAEFPRIADPENGRLWTANARVVDDTALAQLGDNGFEVGSRASIIRDRLMARERFDPADLLAIQLDTSATFLSRWHDLLERTLSDRAASIGTDSRVRDRQELREAIAGSWTGHASPESAAYRFTRAFREQVIEHVSAMLLEDCYTADPQFDFLANRRRETPVWTLVTQQPLHLLHPQYDSWNDLILAAVDRTIDLTRTANPGPLRERTWAEYNVTRYQHPLSSAIPFAGRWLDMPYVPLSGDLYTPNTHWGIHAPSERMVVSPGHEAEGIFEMPVGQSGHPLSPFYDNSHEAWIEGRATPFLPGPPVHQLTLTP